MEDKNRAKGIARRKLIFTITLIIIQNSDIHTPSEYNCGKNVQFVLLHMADYNPLSM